MKKPQDAGSIRGVAFCLSSRYCRVEESYKNDRQKGLGQTQESHDLPDAHISEARRKLGRRLRRLGILLEIC